jgi:hypothetical protein
MGLYCHFLPYKKEKGQKYNNDVFEWRTVKTGEMSKNQTHHMCIDPLI